MKKKDNDISFLAKVILFFRGIRERIAALRIFQRISDRQKVLSAYSGKNISEESRISYVLGVAKVVTVAFLSILLVITLIFGSKLISYEKVYYMVKDISYIKSFYESTPESLSYSKPVQNQTFEGFKNGLLVTSDSEIKLFTSTGRVTLSEGSEMVNPRVSTSNGYALIYDQGRRSFSIYNSFVSLYSENTEYPIALADMADDGEFLIVTSSSRYASVVKIYDSEFKQTAELSKNDRVISASLSPNGRYAAILSLDAKDGAAQTTVTILDCRNNKIISSTVKSGSMPYKAEFLGNDRIAIFLDDKVCAIDKNGKSIGEYIYPSDVERIDVQGDRFAILFSPAKGEKSAKLTVFNASCSVVFSTNVSGNVRDVEIGGGYVYVLKSKELVRINTLLGIVSTKDVNVDNHSIVAFEDGRVIACSAAAGTYISFD